MFHEEQKYRNRLVSLKQQRSLTFLSCDSVRIYFSGCFTGNKNNAIVWPIPETAEKLGFFKLRLCENLFLRVFHGEQKYRNRFSSLKQQRSLTFLSCSSVRIYFSVCFTGTKMTESFGIPETAEKLGFFKLRLCDNLFLRVFHGELKYRNRLASLKQQRSLAFLSCDSVRIYFSGFFTGNKSTTIVWQSLKQQRSLTFLCCSFVGIYFSVCFTGNKNDAIVWHP